MKACYVLSTLALMLIIGTMQPVFAWGGDYGKGDPNHPIGNSTWPSGVGVLANRADRIGGRWINSLDTFFFAGDTKAFNDFLQQYARVKGSHTLCLHIDPALDAFTLQPANGGHQDWELDAGAGMATVSLSLNGRIRLRDLRVPRNITLYFEGKRTKEVDLFLAHHPGSQHQE